MKELRVQSLPSKCRHGQQAKRKGHVSLVAVVCEVRGRMNGNVWVDR